MNIERAIVEAVTESSEFTDAIRCALKDSPLLSVYDVVDSTEFETAVKNVIYSNVDMNGFVVDFFTDNVLDDLGDKVNEAVGEALKIYERRWQDDQKAIKTLQKDNDMMFEKMVDLIHRVNALEGRSLWSRIFGG